MKYAFLFLIVILISCARVSDCSIGGLNIGITNLNALSDDSILVLKFTKNSNFNKLIDSTKLVFENDKDSLNKIHGDSVILTGKQGFLSSLSGSDKNNRGFLNAKFDYIIKTKNHSYQFTELEIAKKTKKCGGILSLDCPDCYSPVVKFKLNNIQNQILENELFYFPN